MSAILQAALGYARRGWPVAPLHTPAQGVCNCPRRADCRDPGKHPRTMHGIDDATVDQTRIAHWWSMWPTANVAIDLERAQLVDLAPDNEHHMMEFREQGLSRTFAFVSGGGAGHEHYLYARPASCPVTRPCRSGEFDIMATGYCVAPPSVHASGQRYQVLVSLDEIPELPVVPLWVIELLRNHAARRAAIPAAGARAVDWDEPPVRLRGDQLELWHGRGRLVEPSDRSLCLVRLAMGLAHGNASRRTILDALADRDARIWRKYAERADRELRYAEIADRALAVLVEPGANDGGGAAVPWTVTVEQRAAWSPEVVFVDD